MGLFDRDTDMSDDIDGDADGPTFEPVPGTTEHDDESDGEGDERGNADPLSRLVGANLRDDDFDGTLKRAVDVEAGVVLYAYGNGNAGGLTAVPIDRTRLLDGE